MPYLLDTNVISELRKDLGKLDSRFKQWAENTDLNHCFLSVLSVLELEQGIRLKEKSDFIQGKILREWLDGYVCKIFQDRMVTICLDTARLAAEFHVPDPAPYYDALIAASAKVHNYTIATRNTKDFARFAVATINPWQFTLDDPS